MKENVATEFELSLGSTDSTIIDGMPAKVKTLMAGEKPGTLKVTNMANGNIKVAVLYDASPFLDMPKPKSFLLNQGELDDYLVKGPNCVLEEKRT
jgi:hypothetical protein